MKDENTRMLIKLYRKTRSPKALNILVKAHQPAIILAAGSSPNNYIEFEDKVQIGNEILLKTVSVNGFDLRYKIKFNTYLISLVKQRILDKIRIEMRKPALLLEEAHYVTEPENNDFELKEQIQVLTKQIQKLPRTEQIVMGCLMQGMTQRAIARQCQVSETRISQIVNEAKRKIKKNIVLF